MNIAFPAIAFFAIALVAPAQSLLADEEQSVPLGHGSPVSLETVIQTVLEKNPAIKEARAKWEATQQRAPQAAAWEDLRVSAGSRVARFVHISPDSFGDQMLSVEQMIPISGKNKSRARMAAAEALMSGEEFRRKQLDLLAKAQASYYRLAITYALLDLNQADQESLKQTVEITRARLEVGGQSQADIFTAENELTKLREARQDLLRAASDEETQLCVLMNRDPFKSLGKPSTKPPEIARFQVDRLKAQIIASRPEVRAAEAAIVVAKEKLGLAKKEWVPDPMLSVQSQRYNDSSQVASEVAVGVSISIPWFNRTKYRAQEKEAASGVEAAERAAESARIEALGMLRDQLRKIETAKHHVELFRDALLPTATQSVESIRAGYETGKAGLLELLISQREVRELRSMIQKHLIDYQTAVAELDALVGASRREPPQSANTVKGSKK